MNKTKHFTKKELNYINKNFSDNDEVPLLKPSGYYNLRKLINWIKKRNISEEIQFF